MRELLTILGLSLFVVWDVTQNDGRVVRAANALFVYLMRQLGVG